MTHTSYYHRISSFLTDGKLWKLKLLTLGMIIIQIIAPFDNKSIKLSDTNSYWPTVERQAEHPFRKIEAHPKSHAANKTFRLSISIIAKILSLKRKEILLIQFALLPIILWSIITLLHRSTGDREVSFLFFLSFLPLYIVVSTYLETSGHLDAFVYCFLLLAMIFPNVYAVFLFTTLACWCDERGVIAVLWVVLWWYNFSKDHPDRSLRLHLSAVSSIVLYSATRLLLKHFLGMGIAMDNPDLTILPMYIHLVPLLAFVSFGPLWSLLIIYTLRTKYQIFSITNIALYLLLFLSFIVASIVWDFTRSMAFTTPMFIIIISHISKLIERDKLISIGLLLSIVSALTPIYHFDGQLNYVPSILYQLYRNGYSKIPYSFYY